MNREEFLHDLRKRLRKLPPDEQANALTYYQEYLDDAGPEGEQEAIASLGSAAQVASEIISEYAIKQTKADASKKTGSSVKTLWVVILGVLASPIALPLAVALAVTILALLFCVFALYLCFYLTAIALALSGIALAAISVFGLFFYPIDALYTLGVGLVCLSLGVATLLFSVWLSRLSIRGLTVRFAGILKREGGQS